MPKESYTIYELATAWQCHWRRIKRMIQRGDLAAFKVGRSWRITHAERLRVEQSGENRLTQVDTTVQSTDH